MSGSGGSVKGNGQDSLSLQSTLSSCLPPEVAALATAAVDALEALAAVRTAPLPGDGVHALGVTWQRLATLAQSGRLALLTAVAGRDDVVPRTRGSQAVAFGQHALGLSRGQAQRDARDAALLTSDDADLHETGRAYAEGAVTQAHVDIATRTHHALGAEARDAVVSADDLHAIAAELGANAEAGVDTLDALLAVVEGGGVVRQIQVVDAVLAYHARRLSVPEFNAVARRIVHHVNPPSDRRAHEERFLHVSQSFDGSWVGKFSCGAAQGTLLKSALKALASPRPGIAVDADGVQRAIPDDRDQGARQMDALMELIAAALAADGVPEPDPAHISSHIPGDTGCEPGNEPGETPASPSRDSGAGGTSGPAAATPPPEGAGSAPTGQPTGGQPVEQSDGQPGEGEPPAQEGEYSVIRPAGVLAAPFPGVDLVLVVGVEHVAAARARRQPGDPPEPPRRPPLAAALGSFRRTAAPPGLGAAGPVEGVDDATLAMFACSASLRAVVLAPDGGVLNLGRSQRLATPAQRRALRARDGGCVIAGCAVPAEGCHAHHVVPWEDGGPTDLDNLVLACDRHHTEIHHGTWQIEMINGVPWVRPPTWVDRSRPLLRNAIHHGATRREPAKTSP